MTPRQKLYFAALFSLVVLIAGLGNSSALAQNTFTIGNLNDPVGPPAADIFLGHETYAYHVFPPEQCSCSEDGFTPLTVSQLLYFDDSQIPATFQVEALLLAANFDTGSNCFVPGPVICNGPPTQFTITNQGSSQVTAPFAACPVQVFNEHYFLALKYTGDVPGFLLIDDQPQECTEYVERGNGWEDMFTFPAKTGGGKSIIFGDIVCGTLSVDTEVGTWGAIKSLYR